MKENPSLQPYKNEDEYLKDLESAILAESGDENGIIDRSELIKAAQNIDIMITNFL